MPTEDARSNKLPKGENNPLFVAVVGITIIAAIAGLAAGSKAPTTALHSNIVFRVEVAAITAVVLYIGAGALWLAWHKTMFKRVGFSAANVEAPDQGAEVSERDHDITEFMDTTTKAVDALEKRLAVLEGTADEVLDDDGDETEQTAQETPPAS